MTGDQSSRVPAFIVGIIVGLVFGGTVLFAIGLFAFSWVGEKNASLTFLGSYVTGIALGTGGLLLTRKGVHFLSGLMIGSAAGMLGSSALCNLVIGAS